MKVLHVITGLQKAAGTSTFCGEVCNQLVALGHDVTIAVNNPSAPDLYPLDPRIHLTSIESILRSTPTPDTYTLIHIHCLWSPILHRVACWARSRHISVVWSTHGMTAPWAMKHKWWKKFLPWHLYQRRDLARAQLIHCTSDFEVEWNHKLGFKKTFIAPLGTFLPEEEGLGHRSRSTADRQDSALASQLSLRATSSLDLDLRPRPKTLLFVGRIYPVKALDRLIEAFALALRCQPQPSTSTWRLRLVGPDQAGHMSGLMSLCSRLGLAYSTPEQNSSNSTVDLDLRPRPSSLVQFVGPKFGPDLAAEYANCDALALVSHTENFGATVIDALAHGKPVITSTNIPWKSVADLKCGWWVDNDIMSLQSAVADLCSCADVDRVEKGARGRLLVEERFTWQSAARAMLRAYEENGIYETRFGHSSASILNPWDAGADSGN